MKKIISFIRQPNKLDCAPACIRIIQNYYNDSKDYSYEELRTFCNTNEKGTSVYNLNKALNEIGYTSKIELIKIDEVKKIDDIMILLVDQNHYVICYEIKNGKYHIVDPARGKYFLTEDQLKEKCVIENDEVIFLEVSGKNKSKKIISSKINNLGNNENLNLKGLYKKVFGYKREIWQVVILILITSLIQLIIPYLTSSIIDIGINYKDFNFIYLILIAQIVLMISVSSVDFIRSWIVTYVGLEINLRLSLDYLDSVLNKKISFFRSKKEGDFLQRLIDNNRIERHLTNTSLSFILSAFNFVLFGIVLLVYNLTIFLVYVCFSLLIVNC